MWCYASIIKEHITWQVFKPEITYFLHFQSIKCINFERSHSSLSSEYTQALHTDRINLSPFTKDFRVWGAPIETFLFLTSHLRVTSYYDRWWKLLQVGDIWSGQSSQRTVWNAELISISLILTRMNRMISWGIRAGLWPCVSPKHGKICMWI